MMKHHILILGGTSEARALAGRLGAHEDYVVTLSLAGRTANPVAQPVPVRIGGFGGSEGLARYLEAERVSLLIDATHPFAAQISRNAAQAATQAGVPLIALRRPAWKQAAGDNWTLVDSVAEAVDALGKKPRRVMVALGRQEVRVFSTAPFHHYLIRSVDPIEPPLGVPDARYILARGPFEQADEKKLLEANRIDAVVSKNSGGAAAYGKIAAARALGLEVVMIARPGLPDVPSAGAVDEAVMQVDHVLASLAKRGV
jgi:precorrin-6A/cobalt-precorrin-6A reductase